MPWLAAAVGARGDHRRIAAEAHDQALRHHQVLLLLVADVLEIGAARAAAVRAERVVLRDQRLVQPRPGALEREPRAQLVEERQPIERDVLRRRHGRGGPALLGEPLMPVRFSPGRVM
jgi:hypothetical protein